MPSVLYKGVSRPKTDDDWRQLLLEASRENVPTYQLAEMYREGMLSITPVRSGGCGQVISPTRSKSSSNEQKLMAMNSPSPPEPTGFFRLLSAATRHHIPPGWRALRMGASLSILI